MMVLLTSIRQNLISISIMKGLNNLLIEPICGYCGEHKINLYNNFFLMPTFPEKVVVVFYIVFFQSQVRADMTF